jgi:hypothetical protein
VVFLKILKLSMKKKKFSKLKRPSKQNFNKVFISMLKSLIRLVFEKLFVNHGYRMSAFASTGSEG